MLSTLESLHDGDSDDDANLLAADMSLPQRSKYASDALRRQLNRARRRGDMHQVQLNQQLITQLIASSMSSASTADNSSTSASGSSGRLPQTNERPSLHGSLLPKDTLTKIVDLGVGQARDKAQVASIYVKQRPAGPDL